MTSRQPLYVVGPRGDVRAYLPDGSPHGEVFPQPYYISSATVDGRVLALGDSETNLYFHLRDEARTIPVRHEELLGRVGRVTLSASGQLAAVTRHADFSKPQALQSEEDRIYLVDVARGEVIKIIAASDRENASIQNIYWGDSAEHLYYSAWSPSSEEAQQWFVRVTIEGEEREALTQEQWERFETPERWQWAWKARSKECPDTGMLSGNDTGLYLTARDGDKPRVLVGVTGRKRGFHDHFDTIPSYHFLPGCDELIFVHDEKVYAYKISVDRLGVLTAGQETWFFAGEPAHEE